MNFVKAALGAVTLILVLSTGAAGAKDQAAGAQNKEQLQRLYVEYLSAEGYRPSIDGDGDVKFKREGRTYFIIVSEKDPEFFRLVLANIWEIENDVERSRVLQAADHSNAASKVSKVYIVKDNVWVCVELFVAAPEDFRGVFQRSMSAMETGVSNYVERMREFPAAPQTPPATSYRGA
ncbi:MAG: hypothetical protein JRJ58_01000 [Deltaproteobacteria bacterium]|nr:hypothetical protein [Deltaproteobacteria bacterium]